MAMEGGRNGERQGLTGSFRSQMGYGTAPITAATKKSTPKTRKFIQRKLCEGDTLVGISLKYGVSVQELKKDNKIWNTDHLFLHKDLLIPLTTDNESAVDPVNDIIVTHDGSSASTAPPPSTSNHAGASTSSSIHVEVEPSSSRRGKSKNSHRKANGDHQNVHEPSSRDPLMPSPDSDIPAHAALVHAQPSASFSPLNPKTLRASSLPLSGSASSSNSSSQGKGKSKRGTTASNSNNNHSRVSNIDSSDSITPAQSSVCSGTSSVADDFFSKYDNNIARLRGDVERMEKNSVRLDGLLDTNPLSLPPKGVRRQSSTASTASEKERRRSRTAAVLVDYDDEEYSKDKSKYTGGATGQDGATQSPVLLIRSRNTHKQVRSAIENLQQADDDLFQL